MIVNNESPISAYLSHVAMGGRPTDDDLTALVRQCITPGGAVTEKVFRREIESATKQIIIDHARGAAGQARAVARETTAVLNASLGELPPTPDRDQGLSTRQIISEIPR